MKTQIPLPLASTRDLRTAPFLEGASNAAAARALTAPFHTGALALVGPAGSGKTHLATQWAQRNAATIIRGDEPAPGGNLVLEAADAALDHEQLFHLLNQALAGERQVLITARTRPTGWQTPLPDLRSRLNALEVAEIAEPDDVLLAKLLRALFTERFISPADDVIPYLLPRIERTFEAAQQVVELLHQAGLQKRREINRALAASTLEVANVINDLFDVPD